jgi:hypothetical protein
LYDSSPTLENVDIRLELFCQEKRVKMMQSLQPIQDALIQYLPSQHIDNRLEITAEFPYTEYLCLD